MSVEIRLEGDGEYTYYSPTLHVESSIGPLVLSYENTVIRTFSDRWKDHLHVEYRSGPQARAIGLILEQANIDWLFEQEFPYRFDPLPDPETTNWFIQVAMKQLEGELQDGSL